MRYEDIQAQFGSLVHAEDGTLSSVHLAVKYLLIQSEMLRSVVSAVAELKDDEAVGSAQLGVASGWARLGDETTSSDVSLRKAAQLALRV